MLVVCSDAGLSLDEAFARINPEVAKQSRAMGMNSLFLAPRTVLVGARLMLLAHLRTD